MGKEALIFMIAFFIAMVATIIHDWHDERRR